MDEFEEEGIMVIEWPEYYQEYLPNDYIEIDFTYIDDNSREINFVCHGSKYENIVKEISC